MTNADLIAELKRLPPDAEVLVENGDGTLRPAQTVVRCESDEFAEGVLIT
jgi:hypothetical protein